MIDVFNLANLYGFETVKATITKHIEQIISMENIVWMLAFVTYHDDLKEVCLKFIDRNSNELMRHDTFKTLPQDLLRDILKRDTFDAPEIDIFNSVKMWYENNPNADVKVRLCFNLENRWILMMKSQIKF